MLVTELVLARGRVEHLVRAQQQLWMLVTESSMSQGRGEYMQLFCVLNIMSTLYTLLY
jgi:hypothetical protein